MSLGTSHHALDIPLSTEAKSALEKFADRHVNYVCFSIDLVKETILLEKCENVGIKEILHLVPASKGKYHLYRFNSEEGGVSKEAVVFIYALPVSTRSVKEKMLYSSSKGPLVYGIERQLGIRIDKKLEVAEHGDLTEVCFIEALRYGRNARLDRASSSTRSCAPHLISRPSSKSTSRLIP